MYVTSATKYKPPAENDISICIGCTGINVFNADLTLRLPTDAELHQVKDSRDVVMAQAAILMMQFIKKRK